MRKPWTRMVVTEGGQRAEEKGAGRGGKGRLRRAYNCKGQD